jgi:CheY-like chemotaxis protein
MKNITQYILIDDDPLCNLISMMIINKNIPGTDVTIFSVPEHGLSYLKNRLINPVGNPAAAVLLLDINMPGMDGWEFLKRYEKFSAQIQPPLSIYMLSSSVYQQDRDKARAKTYIKGFLLKPFSRESIMATKEDWPVNAAIL